MSRATKQIRTPDAETVRFPQRITLRQAADLLNEDESYLIQLLDEGRIPLTGVASHRAIRLDDLLAYKQERDRVRRAALRELTQLCQDEGMEDVDWRIR